MERFEENMEKAIDRESDILSNVSSDAGKKEESLKRLEKMQQIMMNEREMNMKERKFDHDIEIGDVNQRDKEIMFHENQKHKIIEHALRVAELVLPLVCYGIWTTRGFRFEKEGVYTSKTFQNIIGKLKPTKK